jgi:hypothetical protein
MATAVVVHTFDSIPKSRPSAGAFDFTDSSVEFRIVKWCGTPGVVAFCIEHSRLGEEARGHCKLILHDKRSCKYLCSFGKLRSKAKHAKASAGPSLTEGGERRSAIAHGDSCKHGCEYWLKTSLLPGRHCVVVIGVFVSAQGQHSEVKETERVGVIEHTGGGTLSEECRFYVRQALLLDLTTGQIERGACVRACLRA